MKNEKKLLKMAQIKPVNVPFWDECGVKNIYDKVLAQPGMKDYFPDKYPVGRQCSRKYMYTVWNSIHPDQVKEVIEYASAQRYGTQHER